MTTSAKPRVPAVLITALVALIALGTGWFFGVSSVTYPLENSAEVVFARDMRFHHEQAVDMSLRILPRTTDVEMKLFVTDILLTQQNQVGQMTAWLALWGRPQAGAEPPMAGMGAGMGLATQPQLERIVTLPAKDAEILFLQLMHRHHQGGITMAEGVLNKNPKPEVARLAAGIVSGQRVELKVIESLLRRFGGEVPQTLAPMKTGR